MAAHKRYLAFFSEPKGEIMVDAGGSEHFWPHAYKWAIETARMLADYDITWFEEALPPDDIEGFIKLREHSPVPISTGEVLTRRQSFMPWIERGAVDIIQPDVSHAGGITECNKIISMAEAFDVAAAPHCPLGPIALAACLQVDATCHNAFIQEQSLGIHYNQGSDLLDYLANKSVFRFEKGCVAIPEGPGLGIKINEDHVRAMAKTGHNWRNPLWRHKDGSVAEW